MKEVELDLVETEKCESDLRETRLGQNFTIHESFICAGGQPDKDTCQGLKSENSNHCRSDDVRTIRLE
jgi:kallikrein